MNVDTGIDVSGRRDFGFRQADAGSCDTHIPGEGYLCLGSDDVNVSGPTSSGNLDGVLRKRGKWHPIINRSIPARDVDTCGLITSDNWVIDNEANADVATDECTIFVVSARIAREAATGCEQPTGIDDTIDMHQCGYTRIELVPREGIVSQADSGIVQFDPDIKWL